MEKVSDVPNQPFYHLRPNKSIDRSLFLQTLIGLNGKLSIGDYCYTGFGSYLFDDFRLLHETLNISKMISLEKDPIEFQRARFNCPYNCIEIKNVGSTDYLSDLILDDDDHNIFWLDFVAPSELGEQLSDYATLLPRLNPNDVVRITLNAQPDSLGKSKFPDEIQVMRLKKLKERVPDSYFPDCLNAEHMTRTNYPLALLQILESITTQLLDDRPPYRSKFMLPLFSTVYADGQQMLTFTGIVLEKHEDESIIKEILRNYPHNNFSWRSPCRIVIPPLSVRELSEINKLLPNPDIRQQLLDDFPFVFSNQDNRIIDSYIAYYKYYPNFHKVNL